MIEGVRLAEEALAADWAVVSGFYTEGISDRGSAIVAAFTARGAALELVAPQVMTAASDTQSPQGILLELGFQQLPTPKQITLALIADQLRDPGNLGTLMRSASAAGAEILILTPGSADAWAPKVLRSGMGAHFRLPLLEMDWTQIRGFCDQHQLRVLLADTNTGQPVDKADLSVPLALILGGEADGAGPEARALAEHTVHIPMRGPTESLNAAVAGSLILFEAARQRRSKDELA